MRTADEKAEMLRQMKRKRTVDWLCIGLEKFAESYTNAQYAFVCHVYEPEPRFRSGSRIVGQNRGFLKISKATGEVSLVEAMPEDDDSKRFQRAAAHIRKHWAACDFPDRTICGVMHMDPVAKAFAGKDAKTKRRYNAIFNAGFESGARTRVEAGIAQPPGWLPKRSAKIPATYRTRDERVLWSAGYRMGHAIGTPASSFRKGSKT